MLTRLILMGLATVIAVALAPVSASGRTAPAQKPCDLVKDPNCEQVVIDDSARKPTSGQTGGKDPCTYTYDHPHPDGGAWYWKYCPPPENLSQADKARWGNGWLVWLTDPPPPEMLARRALAKISPTGVEIAVAPDPNGAGLVGLPVWMWTRKTATTWGPLSATDTDNGLTASITAQAVEIVWDMGDGHTVACRERGGDYIGTPYQPSYEGKQSPDCGYSYTAPSRDQPGGRYTVTATTTWQITWTAGASRGVFLVTRNSQTTLRIDELQVVVR